MPKMRGIKPEFWTDDAVVDCSAYARLLFIGMWNHACDNGHLADKPRQLQMRILPADGIPAGDLLDELAKVGLITREDGWITIKSFAKHQQIDKRFFITCDCPGCEKPITKEPTASNDEPTQKPDEPTESHDETTTSARGGHGEPTTWAPGGLHDEGEGEGEGELKTARDHLIHPSSPNVKARARPNATRRRSHLQPVQAPPSQAPPSQPSAPLRPEPGPVDARASPVPADPWPIAPSQGDGWMNQSTRPATTAAMTTGGEPWP